MSNMPVFYVDRLMYFLTSEEFKLLAFLTHKIVGEEVPFATTQMCRLNGQDMAKATGMSQRMVNKAITELLTYGVVVMAATDQGIAWMLGPLDDIDIEGLQARKQGVKS